MPRDRAMILVDPAGTIPNAALESNIPVATSETVPSPPTAITRSLDRDASLAAADASADEVKT
jgi:hypothetical protein